MIGQWLGQGKREDLVRNFVKEHNFLHQDVRIEMEFPENLFGEEKGNENINIWNKRR